MGFEEGLERTIKWFVSKKTQLIDRAGKTEKTHKLLDPNYAESLFPLQFSSVLITRSRKQLALNTLNIWGI